MSDYSPFTDHLRVAETTYAKQPRHQYISPYCFVDWPDEGSTKSAVSVYLVSGFMNIPKLYVHPLDSPLGKITLVTLGDRLVSVDFDDCHARMLKLLEARFGAVDLHKSPDPNHVYCDRLQSYFSGDLSALNGVSTDPGGTSFQQQVWSYLQTIPPGQTVTYKDIAQGILNPRAAQAVGRANALNPILFFLPCHRVMGSNQSYVGYSGGIERKAWLIQHEKQYEQRSLF